MDNSPKIRVRMADLTEAAGGEVEDGLFVVQPGVALLYTGKEVTAEGMRLMGRMNINADQSPERQIAELAARLTYFSFPKRPETLEESDSFHNRLQQLRHLSPYRVAQGYEDNSNNVVMLFAGICAETALEVIANKGHVGRLTTSRVGAMSSPLFRLEGPEESRRWQRTRIKGALETKRAVLRQMAEHANYELLPDQDPLEEVRKILKASLKLPQDGNLSGEDKKRFEDELERLNRQDPGSKALYLVDGKPLKHWGEWFLKGRLSEWATIESELLEVLVKVANQLHAVFPQDIKSADEYMNNTK
ncbi:MAG: hypothetical protein AAB373_00600 [Patescibacteria group bacterium]